MPAKLWHCTLKSKDYLWNEKTAWEINIALTMLKKWRILIKKESLMKTQQIIILTIKHIDIYRLSNI